MYDSAWPILHHAPVWELTVIARISMGSFESQPKQPFSGAQVPQKLEKISLLLDMLQGGPTLRCLDILHRELRHTVQHICSL